MDVENLNAVLDEVQKGHPDAFYKIISEFGLPLRSYLCSHLYRVEDADDLAQEIFIAAYTNLKRFRRGEDFNRWLFGIANNKLQDYFRAKARQKSALDRFKVRASEILDVDLRERAIEEPSGSIEALLLCINKLPDKLRMVVRGGLDGNKPAVMAENLSTTVPAVYNLQYRAIQLLKTCIEKELA